MCLAYYNVLYHFRATIRLLHGKSRIDKITDELVNMPKRAIHDFNYAIRQESGVNPSACGQVSRKGMPTIRCVCGAEMLVVPDLNAMNRAVENHVAEHGQMGKSGGNGQMAPRKLRLFLIRQILTAASLTNA